jgi:hypothetical protein
MLSVQWHMADAQLVQVKTSFLGLQKFSIWLIKKMVF